MIEDEDVKKFQESVLRFEGIFDRRKSESNNATINVNAGGMGLWVAVTCCIVMFFCSIICATFFVITIDNINAELRERKEENSKMQSYLNAIYVNAPSLKPTDKK